MDALQGYVVGCQSFGYRLIDLVLAIDNIFQGGLVGIEITIVPFLVVWVWLIPPLASLWMVPVVVVHEEDVFTGLGAIILGVSSIATGLTHHGDVQGLGLTVHLRLVPSTFLQALQEEVHLSGEHVCLLDGVHAPLKGLELLFTPSLVGHHLLN